MPFCQGSKSLPIQETKKKFSNVIFIKLITKNKYNLPFSKWPHAKYKNRNNVLSRSKSLSRHPNLCLFVRRYDIMRTDDCFRYRYLKRQKFIYDPSINKFKKSYQLYWFAPLENKPRHDSDWKRDSVEIMPIKLVSNPKAAFRCKNLLTSGDSYESTDWIDIASRAKKKFLLLSLIKARKILPSSPWHTLSRSSDLRLRPGDNFSSPRIFKYNGLRLKEG